MRRHHLPTKSHQQQQQQKIRSERMQTKMERRKKWCQRLSALTHKSQFPRSKLTRAGRTLKDTTKKMNEKREKSPFQAFDEFRVHFISAKTDGRVVVVCCHCSAVRCRQLRHQIHLKCKWKRGRAREVAHTLVFTKYSSRLTNKAKRQVNN